MIGSQLSSTASFPTSSALPLLTAPPLPCTKHTLYHGTPYDRGGILPHGTVWSLQVLTCVFLQQEHLFWEDFHANHPHPHHLPTPSPVRQPSWAPIASHSHELLFSVFSCLFCPKLPRLTLCTQCHQPCFFAMSDWHWIIPYLETTRHATEIQQQ